MQKDMHFYGTYAVARIAGFSPEEAKTVATAAQYVDESVAAKPVNLDNQSYMLQVVSAHRMLELDKNSDEMDQWNVWLPFHFLPGGVGSNVEERLICLWGEPGNVAVDGIIDFVLDARAVNEPYALHLLGIVTHVIQDTYAHYGFSGVASDLNLVDQSSLKLLNVSDNMADYISDKLDGFWDRLSGFVADATRLGHAGVATCPDRPYLEWEFDYEVLRSQGIDSLGGPRRNAESFYYACTRLHALYKAFIARDLTIRTDDGHFDFEEGVADEIKRVLETEGKKDDRIEAWRDCISSSALFEVEPQEIGVRFNSKGWGVKGLIDNAAGATADAHKFHWAAIQYLNHVHDVILPQMNILIR